MQPNVYLFFKGNCLEAMTHYADTLGGTIEYVMRNADAPDAESRMPGGDDMVMNMSMKIGDVTVMASDSPDSMYKKPQGLRLQLEPDTRAEFDCIENALASNAETVEMPADETFWAERFTMFTDRFGTPWMINYTGNKAQG